VDIKACLARGDIPRAWRQVKITFKPAHGKVNYTQAKTYCPISLLSFMYKTMQKLVKRNIKDETVRQFPYKYNNIEFFLNTVAATDSTSQDITKAVKWHGLRDTLYRWIGYMLGGKKVTAPQSQRNTGRVCGQVLSAEGHCITP
jgi:hypothetical protein